MDSRDRDHFEEIIIKAVQSGKQETSGLVSEMKMEISLINRQIAANRFVANETAYRATSGAVGLTISHDWSVSMCTFSEHNHRFMVFHWLAISV